jgi:hypothetical protein
MINPLNQGFDQLLGLGLIQRQCAPHLHLPVQNHEPARPQLYECTGTTDKVATRSCQHTRRAGRYDTPDRSRQRQLRIRWSWTARRYVGGCGSDGTGEYGHAPVGCRPSRVRPHACAVGAVAAQRARRYQRTASVMTSGWKRNPANSEHATVTRPVDLTTSGCSTAGRSSSRTTQQSPRGTPSTSRNGRPRRCWSLSAARAGIAGDTSGLRVTTVTVL